MTEQDEYDIEFIKELATLEYSDEIKEFYKDGRELVEKLNIFKL